MLKNSALPKDLLDPLFKMALQDCGNVRKELARVLNTLEKRNQQYPEAPLMAQIMEMVFKNLPKEFENKEDEQRFSALEKASVTIAKYIDTGNILTRPPFHNRGHFLNVQICGRLIDRVNFAFYEARGPFAGSVNLSAADLACAAVTDLLHDLDHDGLGNTRDGIYQPMFLETQSVEHALPFLLEEDVSDKDIGYIISSVLASDPLLPKEIMRAAYDVHFNPNTKKIKSIDWTSKFDDFDEPTQEKLSGLVEILNEDKQATAMAARLNDADLFASFGISENRSCKENKKLDIEFKNSGVGALCDAEDHPIPQARLYALLKILNGFVSPKTRMFEANFRTSGAQWLNADTAYHLQKHDEKAIGSDKTQAIYKIAGITL